MLELDYAFHFHGEGCGILTSGAVLPVVACPGAVALVANRAPPSCRRLCSGRGSSSTGWLRGNQSSG